MSARKREVRLTEDADRDLDDILLYGLRELGIEQAMRYQALIERSIATLPDFPDIGFPRDDAFPGSRARIVGVHVIYYRITDELIEVLRILHGHAKASQHLWRLREHPFARPEPTHVSVTSPGGTSRSEPQDSAFGQSDADTVVDVVLSPEGTSLT
jgi:toxin ParE1/3/4